MSGWREKESDNAHSNDGIMPSGFLVLGTGPMNDFGDVASTSVLHMVHLRREMYSVFSSATATRSLTSTQLRVRTFRM